MGSGPGKWNRLKFYMIINGSSDTFTEVDEESQKDRNTPEERHGPF